MAGDMSRASLVGLLLARMAASTVSTSGRWPRANFTGGSIPMMGFGAGFSVESCHMAFKAGYRHLDTAFAHKNHRVLGEAIRTSGLPREEFFLTTKVGGVMASQTCCFGLLELPAPLTDPHVSDPLAGGGAYAKGRELDGIRLALQETGLDYIDLCLIHRPGVTALEVQAVYLPHYHNMNIVKGTAQRELAQGLLNAAVCLETAAHGRDALTAKRADAWRQLEEAKRRGLCRYIGVSNYPIKMLKEMESYARELPQVLQIEHTPTCQFPEILAYAREKNMAVTGYGTGVSRGQVGGPLRNVAGRLNRTPNQVLLRWRLQQGVGILQGTSQPRRLQENLEVMEFELSPGDMEELNRLNRDYPMYFDHTWYNEAGGCLPESVFTLLLALFAGTLGFFGCFCCCCCCCRPCRSRAKKQAGSEGKKGD